jgi:ArsR family transcriptional regulator, lead/cadmium/zinc/bismuth-responsive transcriptional repressor
MNTCSYVHLDPNRVASLKARLLSQDSVDALAETFKVLGDSTRVRILDALGRAELCVCDLARLLGLSDSAVSHQLRVLRGMRLVRPRRDGKMIFYTLDDQHIVRLFEQGLEHVEERTRALLAAPVGLKPRAVGRRR